MGWQWLERRLGDIGWMLKRAFMYAVCTTLQEVRKTAEEEEEEEERGDVQEDGDGPQGRSRTSRRRQAPRKRKAVPRQVRNFWYTSSHRDHATEDEIPRRVTPSVRQENSLVPCG